MEDSGDVTAVVERDNKPGKVPMAPEERLKLAEKLDEDLDNFISGLEKRSYEEGWPEDRWQEEMEKHPFFMTKAPEAGEELSPLLQGLQDLKYDTSENTPEELALTYKEDGNFNFKCKKYRLAIMSYTEGLKQKCHDEDLNAQLYNNRSASHYFLKNYRSSLNDCLSALKLKPDYIKTLCRAAQCYYHLRDYSKCIEYCDIVTLKEPHNSEIGLLRKEATNKRLAAERDVRKKKFQEKITTENKNKLLKAVRERGIKLLGYESEELTLSSLETKFPAVVNRRVYLDNGRLIWPVIFLYPEYKMTDFVQEFHEDSCFNDHLIEMFHETAPWDTEKKYNPENIAVYYEDENGKAHSVLKTSSLGQIISRDDFRVDHGTPAFIILVKNSNAERIYLSSA
ncbi:DNA polymerase interacting tpr containing protein of 47kD [Lycorma delicatula]|uniref:DNA polymerase interacting tpr containing protein of 47kD n=1 Tax=Lycorma delicatula TaxID=130591 RepID=UPI003F5117AA